MSQEFCGTAILMILLVFLVLMGSKRDSGSNMLDAILSELFRKE